MKTNDSYEILRMENGWVLSISSERGERARRFLATSMLDLMVLVAEHCAPTQEDSK